MVRIKLIYQAFFDPIESFIVTIFYNNYFEKCIRIKSARNYKNIGI